MTTNQTPRVCKGCGIRDDDTAFVQAAGGYTDGHVIAGAPPDLCGPMIAMTTNQTPEQALDAAVESMWLKLMPLIRGAIRSRKGNKNEYSYDLPISDIWDIIRAELKAMHEAGRREALEDVKEKCKPWCRTLRRLHLPVGGQCDVCAAVNPLINALATPTETKP